MKYVSKLIPASTFIAVMVLSACLGQFSQIMYSHHDVRESNLDLWASDNQEKKAILQKFTEKCLIGGPVKTGEEIRPLVSHEDCAEKVGASGLIPALQASNSVLKSYSWPLSLVAKYAEIIGLWI